MFAAPLKSTQVEKICPEERYLGQYKDMGIILYPIYPGEIDPVACYGTSIYLQNP